MTAFTQELARARARRRWATAALLRRLPADLVRRVLAHVPGWAYARVDERPLSLRGPSPRDWAFAGRGALVMHQPGLMVFSSIAHRASPLTLTLALDGVRLLALRVPYPSDDRATPGYVWVFGPLGGDGWRHVARCMCLSRGLVRLTLQRARADAPLVTAYDGCLALPLAAAVVVRDGVLLRLG